MKTTKRKGTNAAAWFYGQSFAGRGSLSDPPREQPKPLTDAERKALLDLMAAAEETA